MPEVYEVEVVTNEVATASTVTSSQLEVEVHLERASVAGQIPVAEAVEVTLLGPVKMPEAIPGPQGLTRYLVQDGAAYPARPLPVEAPVTFVGAANPDTLGVMLVGDSWINTAADSVIPYVKHYDGAGSPEGVVTAQIGSRYIDVNATCGAVEWIKMSGSGTTGWRVSRGDTGWRNVTTDWALMWSDGSAITVSQYVAVRRINESVRWRLHGIGKSTASVVTCGAPTPVGWRDPYMTTSAVLFGSALQSGRIYGIGSGSFGALWQGPITTAISGDVEYLTNDAWPTTLPGTAV